MSDQLLIFFLLDTLVQIELKLRGKKKMENYVRISDIYCSLEESSLEDLKFDIYNVKKEKKWCKRELKLLDQQIRKINKQNP